MKMVASARLRRAQVQMLEARPYAYKMKEVIQDVARHAPVDVHTHPLLRENRAAERSAIVVITSDKGLCGGFNALPVQAAGRWLLEKGNQGDVMAVGRKAVDFLRRTGVKPHQEWAGFWQELNWIHADAIGQELIDGYASGRWSQVLLVYNRFKSMISQQLVQEVLLPLAGLESGSDENKDQHEFEPSAGEIFSHLLPRYIKNAVWHALLESKAAELAARMQSMSNASDNAGEMIAELTLQMNRARQAVITREISELVGSAEAINA
jgi:F-type H+-transporting ATPase subunit gamma